MNQTLTVLDSMVDSVMATHIENEG